MEQISMRCMRCKENKSIVPEVEEKNTSKGIKYMLFGKCPTCGTRMTKFASKEVADKFKGTGKTVSKNIVKKEVKEVVLPPHEVINGKIVINIDPKMKIVDEETKPKKSFFR